MKHYRQCAADLEARRVRQSHGDIKLLSAHKKLVQIERTEASFKFSTDVLRDKLNAFAQRVAVQKFFLKTYLSTAAANRQSLFYNRQVSQAK